SSNSNDNSNNSSDNDCTPDIPTNGSNIQTTLTSKRPRPENTIPALPTPQNIANLKGDVDLDDSNSPAKRSRRSSLPEIDIGSIHLTSQSAPASPTLRSRPKVRRERSTSSATVTVKGGIAEGNMDTATIANTTPATTTIERMAASREGTPRPRPKPYICQHPGCTMAYAKPCKLEEHIRIHTGERPFKCTIPGCASAFRRSTNLAVHLRSHSNQRDAICPVVGCGKAFNSNHKLKRHLRSHETIELSADIACTLSAEQIQETIQQSCEEKPLTCHWEGCNRRFAKRQQLNAHVSMDHRGTKPYVCDHEGCAKDFMTPSKLRKHQLTHSETRRYECGYLDCNQVFNKWSILQKHVTEVHKKIPCPICAQPFLRKNMGTHIQTHSSVQARYPCPYEDCTKSFSSNPNRKKHIQTAHEKSKAFKCVFEGCGKIFQWKHVLQKHTHTIHLSPLKKRKKRSDAIVLTEIEELIGPTEERYRELRPIACAVSTCQQRFSTWKLMERHLLSKAHEEDMLWMEVPQEILLQDLESLHVADQQQEATKDG
ncbi:hypothetical protein BGW41_004611, partial [Actinomortierella wolfii]